MCSSRPPKSSRYFYVKFIRRGINSPDDQINLRSFCKLVLNFYDRKNNDRESRFSQKRKEKTKKKKEKFITRLFQMCQKQEVDLNK